MDSNSEKDLLKDLKRLLSYIKIDYYSSEKHLSCLEAMKTIMGLCANIASVKDILREIGGLACFVDYICSTSDLDDLENGFKLMSCAVDQNSFNQSEMTKSDVFILIRNTLAREDVAPSLLKSALILTSTLLYQNPVAQNMFNESGCLQCCVDLYQEVFPSFMLGHTSISYAEGNESRAEIWQAVHTVLCLSMVNPVNTINQNDCAKLLPVAIKLLQCSAYCEIVSSVTSFISNLIVDNKKNMCLLLEDNGLSILKNCLEVGVMSIVANDCSLIPKGEIQATVGIISLIDLYITENDENTSTFAKSGVVSLISRLLFMCSSLSDNDKTKIFLALGHFIENSDENIQLILSEGNLKTFLKKISKSSNDDVLKACQYFIHLILMNSKLNGDASNLLFRNANRDKIFQFPESSVSCVTEMHEKRNACKRSSSFTSASSASHMQSQILLSRTKQERVSQYLKQLDTYNLNQKKIQTSTYSHSSNSQIGALSNGSNTIKYFNKKLGSHPSLVKKISRDIKNNSEQETLSEQQSENHCNKKIENKHKLNCCTSKISKGYQQPIDQFIQSRVLFDPPEEHFTARSIGAQVSSRLLEEHSCQNENSIYGNKDLAINTSNNDLFAKPYAVAPKTKSIAIQAFSTPSVKRSSYNLFGKLERCGSDYNYLKSSQNSSNLSSFLQPHLISPKAKSKVFQTMPAAKELMKLDESLHGINSTLPYQQITLNDSNLYSSSMTPLSINDDIQARSRSLISDTAKLLKKTSSGNKGFSMALKRNKSKTNSSCSFNNQLNSKRGNHLQKDLKNVSFSVFDKSFDVSSNIINAPLSIKRPNFSECKASTPDKKSKFGKGDTVFTRVDKSDSYFDVFLFPSKKCAEHGLLNNCEKLWFSPIEDV